jgi:hypothetical protein
LNSGVATQVPNAAKRAKVASDGDHFKLLADLSQERAELVKKHEQQVQALSKQHSQQLDDLDQRICNARASSSSSQKKKEAVVCAECKKEVWRRVTLALIALCLAYNPSARSLDRLLSHFSYVRHNEGISSSVPFVPIRLARSAQVRNRINVRNAKKSTAIAACTTSTNAPGA